MLSRYQKQRLHVLVEGILDAIEQQPETAEAFKTWGPVKASPQNAASLLSSSEGLIQKLGFPCQSGARGFLVFRLLSRYMCYVATRDNDPLPTDLGVPEFSPRIGRRFRFEFTIPDYFCVRDVRNMLHPRPGSPRPAGALADRVAFFVEQVEAQIRSVEEAEEKAAKKPKGGPRVASYANGLRRDGRFLFLMETKRSTKEALVQELHDSLGEKHAYDQGESAYCESCRSLFPNRIKGAREILLLAE